MYSFCKMVIALQRRFLRSKHQIWSSASLHCLWKLAHIPHTNSNFSCRKFYKVRQQEIKGRQGGYSKQFRIGVCRQGSQTLTLFKGIKWRFDTPFKAQNQKYSARFKGVTSARTAIRPFKIAVLNLETCIQACSTVLNRPYLFRFARWRLILQFSVPTQGISKDHNIKKDTLFKD